MRADKLSESEKKESLGIRDGWSCYYSSKSQAAQVTKPLSGFEISKPAATEGFICSRWSCDSYSIWLFSVIRLKLMKSPLYFLHAQHTGTRQLFPGLCTPPSTVIYLLYRVTATGLSATGLERKESRKTGSKRKIRTTFAGKAKDKSLALINYLRTLAIQETPYYC